MTAFLDLFPLAAFFIAFKLKGILFATGVIIVATLVQVAATWLISRKVKKMHLITAGLMVVFGGLTLYMEDPKYLQWKFTLVYWLFALTFLTSIWWGKKPLVQTMLETAIQEGGAGELNIQAGTWQKLNLIWVAMFFALGAVNIYILRNFSLEVWTDFKVFYATAAFLLFIVANMAWLFRHLPEEQS